MPSFGRLAEHRRDAPPERSCIRFRCTAACCRYRPSGLLQAALPQGTVDKACGESSRPTVPHVEATYGKGKVIYCPSTSRGPSSVYGHELLGALMEVVLREAASGPPPVVGGRRPLSRRPHRRGGGAVWLHLLNDIPPWALAERRGRVALHAARSDPRSRHPRNLPRQSLRTFKRVPAASSAATVGRDGLTVCVPQLDLHGLVVAEP
jgi:hypothetical protein